VPTLSGASPARLAGPAEGSRLGDRRLVGLLDLPVGTPELLDLDAGRHRDEVLLDAQED